MDDGLQLPAEGALSNFLRRAAYGASTIPLAPAYLYTAPRKLGQALGVDMSYMPGDRVIDHGVEAYEGMMRGALNTPRTENVGDAASEAAGFAFLNPTNLVTRTLPTATRQVINAIMAAPESVAGKAALTGVVAAMQGGVNAVRGESGGLDVAEQNGLDVADDAPGLDVAGAEPGLEVIDPVAVEQDNNDMLSKVVKYGAPALVATGVALAALRGRSARHHAQQTSELIGFAPTVDIVPTAAKVEGAYINRTAPITATLEQASPGSAQAFTDFIQLRINPMAQAERIKAAIRDGQLPYSSIKFDVTPKQWFDSYAKLSQEQMKVLNDGIAAFNETDNRSLGIFNVTHKTDADLQTMIGAMRADPLTARASEEYSNIMRKTLDFMKDRGLLTAQEHIELATRRPNYMPEMQAQRTSWWQKLGRTVTGSDADNDGFQLLDRLFQRQGGQTQFFNPADAMEQYLGTVLRYADLNDVRRTTITAIDNAARGGPRGNPWQGVLDRASAPGDGVITVRDGGQFKYWKVNDPVLHTALQHLPQTVVPVMNELRRVYQNMTTGLGAPWFMLRAMTYDAWAAANLAPKGVNVGLFPGDVVGSVVDAGVGAVRGIYGNMVRGAANAFDASFRNDGVISRILGPANTQALAHTLGDAYSRGALAAFERGGIGGNTRFREVADISDMYSILKEVSPQYASSVPAVRSLWNGYKAVVDSFQNGSRLQAIARNWRPGMNANDEARLFNQVRHLTGDFGEKGGGTLAGVVTTSTPYANVTLQTLSQYARMAREQPLRTMQALTFSTAVPVAYVTYNLANLGPEYIDYYFNQLTPEQRSTFVPLFIPGVRPEDAPRIAVPQEMRPIVSTVIHGMDALFGISNGKINTPEMAHVREALDTFFNNERLKDDVKAGVASIVVPALPPALGLAFNLAGRQVQTGGAEGLAAHNIADNRLSSEEGYRVPINADADAITRVLENNEVAAVVSSLLGAAGQAGLSFLQSTDQSLREGAPIATAAATGVRELVFDVARRVPEGNLLWQVPQRLSTQTVEARALREKIDGFEKIARVVSGDIKGEDVTNTGAQRQQLPYGTPRGIADPMMQPILVEADQFGKLLQQRVLLPVKQLQEQMRLLDTRSMAPEARATERNMIVQQINALNAAALQQTRAREEELSGIYGRRIAFDKLDRSTRFTDLAPLPAPVVQPALTRQ